MRGHSSLRGAPNSRHNSGFTLVELVISIMLIGILGAVGSSMISDSFTTTRMVDANDASMGQARYALERLAREIREIKYVSGTGTYCINTMTATNLAFYKTSGTLDPTCSTNTITIAILNSGSNLTLQYSSPAVTSSLSNQVDTNGFQLLYYQKDGTTAATSGSNIAFVQIKLTVKDSTSGQSISQRTRVALRNA